MSLCTFGSDCDNCGARSQADLAKYTVSWQKNSGDASSAWMLLPLSDIYEPSGTSLNGTNVLTLSQTYQTYYDSSGYARPAPVCTPDANEQCPDCNLCAVQVEVQGQPGVTATEYPCDACQPGLRRITLEQDIGPGGQFFRSLCGLSNRDSIKDPKACAVARVATNGGGIGERSSYERCPL